MRHLVVPNAVAGINFLASIVCMCSAAAGTVGTSAVLVLPDIHCSLAVGAATAVVDGLVATDGASDAGSATVAVSVVAGAVSAGVSTMFLSAAVLSTSLVCPVQTCPSPSVFSLYILVQLLFHLETFYAVRACMNLRTCGRPPF